MFQKGQLVQSRKYGGYFIVDYAYRGDGVYVTPATLEYFPKRILFFPNDRLRLIGNNYRPKARK